MARYPVTVDGEVPDAGQIEEVLVADFRPMPPASDAEAWGRVAERPWVADRLPALRDRAEEIASAPLEVIRATDYLDFFRTGRRDAYGQSARGRLFNLVLLTAVECLAHEDRFLDALLDLSWAVAEETSWVMPAHLRHGADEVLPDPAVPDIDLRAASVAGALAEMLFLLRDRMEEISPMWPKRIQMELARRSVEPYLSREFFWETRNFNWNAVCTDGVVSAALFGDFDASTKARALHKGLRSAQAFLSGFAEDGGCSEGPGYWRYGISHFCRMSYLARRATGGAIDLLADPLVPRVLAYPPKVILSDSQVVNFADCGHRTRFASGPVAWAARECDASRTAALTARDLAEVHVRGTVLDVFLAPEPASFEPPAEAFLPDLMVLTARHRMRAGQQLALAVKGGHNGEHHNHNDVGNFIVHWRGRSLICDLGSRDYTEDNFGPNRYDYLANNSRGHNVPLVNGCEQPYGAEQRATEFRRIESDDRVGVSMELKEAYPADAGLRSLKRRVTLDRSGDGEIILTDEVEFSGEERSYSLPLYTEGRFERETPGRMTANTDEASLEVEFDPDLLEAEIEAVEHGEKRLARRFGPELSRCTLSLKGAPARAEVTLAFRPVA